MRKDTAYRLGWLGFLFLLICFIQTSCSIRKMAIESVADSLSATGNSTVFTGDDDPQLIGDSMPVIMKAMEALCEQSPRNPDLHLATGKAFIMYANAFVHTPATMLPDDSHLLKSKQLKRAKKLYLRGYRYGLKGLELKYPGIHSRLREKKSPDVLSKLQKEDTAYLFWTAAGWMGAYSTNAMDLEMGLEVPTSILMMKKALELDPSYGKGSIHGFFISYYGALPASMGGGEAKARHHYQKALEFSNNLSASAYVSLATTVSVKKQDADEFTDLLNKALAINVDEDPSIRLVNIIMQDKARWLLAHKEDKFL